MVAGNTSKDALIAAFREAQLKEMKYPMRIVNAF